MKREKKTPEAEQLPLIVKPNVPAVNMNEERRLILVECMWLQFCAAYVARWGRAPTDEEARDLLSAAHRLSRIDVGGVR